MNKRKQIKTVSILAMGLGILAAFSGSLQAKLLVYEPFDPAAGYTAGGADLLGQTGGTV